MSTEPGPALTAMSPAAAAAIAHARATLLAALNSREALAVFADLLPDIQAVVVALTPNKFARWGEEIAFKFVADRIDRVVRTAPVVDPVVPVPVPSPIVPVVPVMPAPRPRPVVPPRPVPPGPIPPLPPSDSSRRKPFG